MNRIADWLRSQGLIVDSTARGHWWIAFSGTAAQVQQAFHTEIHRYQAGESMHFAAATPSLVPTELEPLITGIRGLEGEKGLAAARFRVYSVAAEES